MWWCLPKERFECRGRDDDMVVDIDPLIATSQQNQITPEAHMMSSLL